MRRRKSNYSLTSIAMTDEKEEKKEEAEKTEGKPVPAPAAEAQAPKADEPKDKVEQISVPERFKKIVEEIEKMSVLELHELVKVFESKFGVSATAVALAPAGAGVAEAGDEAQSVFVVELTNAGAQKIAVIKAVKEVLGLGLKEAKDMVDGAPSVMKEGVKKEEAEGIKTKIEAAGGSVTLK